MFHPLFPEIGGSPSFFILLSWLLCLIAVAFIQLRPTEPLGGQAFAPWFVAAMSILLGVVMSTAFGVLALVATCAYMAFCLVVSITKHCPEFVRKTVIRLNRNNETRFKNQGKLWNFAEYFAGR